jgi:hypothetical protein
MAKRRMIVVVPEEAIADVVHFCLAHSIEMHVLKEREEEEEEGVIFGPAPAHMRKKAHLLEHRPHEPHREPKVDMRPTESKGTRGHYKKRKTQSPPKYPNFPRKEADAVLQRLMEENDGNLNTQRMAQEAERLRINQSSLQHALWRLKNSGQIVRIAISSKDGATYRRVVQGPGNEEHPAVA